MHRSQTEQADAETHECPFEECSYVGESKKSVKLHFANTDGELHNDPLLIMTDDLNLIRTNPATETNW